ncbi:coiled-coil domain-containing protein 190 isoform X3 [Sturnira hondurensis]|uniref:coiled-coil domain-containing protein 190 isoform X3 n=1 Tax=Sturnira hondurensis TaxID=192404 RepID=UPI00187948FE|nr:coiled-coil domain-containing protein 190 isoform X3 [Sturnira hondurensis]
MEGHMARERLHRHLDLERRHAKQAEARLHQHLQRLERTCLYHLRLLSWEQRQLHRERERLQQHIRSKCPASFRNGFQQRPGDAAVCPAQGERRGAPRASGRRAPATTNPKRGTHKNGSQEPPSRHTGPKDLPSPSQTSAASDVTEEKPADRAACTEPTHPDLGASPAEDLGGVCDEEARSGDATLQPDHSTGKPMSPRATGCEGNPDSEPSASSLPQLFARAAHARYLRHRVPPESERVLSLPEIFGHGDPATQGRAVSQSPPL